MARVHDDDGFTIIELMVAMMVMLIITVPLVTSFVLGIRTTSESQQEVTNSADAQVSAGFFDTDVASALTVSKPAGGCGADTGTVQLALTWQTEAGTQVVAYVTTPDPTPPAALDVQPLLLYRVACGPSSSELVVGRQLVDAPGNPEFTCDGDPGCTNPKPRTVSMTVREHSQLLSDAPGSDVYTFTLTGTRKVTP